MATERLASPIDLLVVPYDMTIEEVETFEIVFRSKARGAILEDLDLLSLKRFRLTCKLFAKIGLEHIATHRFVDYHRFTHKSVEVSRRLAFRRTKCCHCFEPQAIGTFALLTHMVFVEVDLSRSRISALPETLIDLELRGCTLEYSSLPSRLKYCTIRDCRCYHPKADVSADYRAVVVLPRTLIKLVLTGTSGRFELPDGLRRLITDMKSKLVPNELPRGLVTLVCEWGNKKRRRPLPALPPNLKYLATEAGHHPVGPWPPSLAKLTLSDYFDERVVGLPNSLTHLTFGKRFNQEIDDLPSSLTYLVFGRCFNKRVDNLPPNITFLSFGCRFNQSLKRLPKRLLTLRLGNNFVHHVDNLPEGLLVLILGNQFSGSVDHLPKSLRVLELGESFNGNLDRLPPSLLCLKLNTLFVRSVDFLPPALTVLRFSDHFDERVDHLPQSLASVRFGESFNQPVDHLPCSLDHIAFGKNFNQPVDHLPCRLKRVEFGYRFNRSVDNLPRPLERIEFGELFNQPVDNLPPRVATLKLGLMFNHPVNRLPRSLKTLKIENCLSETAPCPIFGYKSDYVFLFDFRHGLDDLPEGLEVLYLFINRERIRLIKRLPSTIQRVYTFAASELPGEWDKDFDESGSFFKPRRSINK